MSFIVEIVVPHGQLASRMAQMRFWLDGAKSQPTSFRSIGADTIQVGFPQELQAVHFASAFGGNLRALGRHQTVDTEQPSVP